MFLRRCEISLAFLWGLGGANCAVFLNRKLYNLTTNTKEIRFVLAVEWDTLGIPALGLVNYTVSCRQFSDLLTWNRIIYQQNTKEIHFVLAAEWDLWDAGKADDTVF